MFLNVNSFASQGFSRLAWPVIFPNCHDLRYIIRSKWKRFLVEELICLHAHEYAIIYFVCVSIRLHYLLLLLSPPPVELVSSSGFRKKYFVPFHMWWPSCRRSKSSFLALWVRCYNLLIALCIKKTNFTLYRFFGSEVKRKPVVHLLFLKQMLICIRHTHTQFLKGYTLLYDKELELYGHHTEHLL
jgi:hypothetical protein